MNKDSRIKSNLFLIYLADSSGYVLGDIKSRHLMNIDYIPIISELRFQVDLNEIMINNKSYSISNESSLITIIDLGSSITYFPMEIYNFIIKAIESFSLNETLCSEKIEVNNLGKCYVISDPLVYDLIDYFFPITFIFKTNAQYVKEIKNLFIIESKYNNKSTICLGFSGWTKNEIVLGNSWIQNHNIIFDRENNRIGFTKGNCTRSITAINYQSNTTITKTDCAEKYQSMFSIIYVILLCIIAFLSTALFYIKKGKRFFCFIKKYNTIFPQSHQVIDDEIEMAIGIQRQ